LLIPYEKQKHSAKKTGGDGMRLDIKIAILKSEMKQYELAQMLGIPESTLSKFVRGYGVLSPARACMLAQIIGLSREGSIGAEGNHGHIPNAH
jgi:transcriptional regulator with XRE-family HTH domain